MSTHNIVFIEKYEKYRYFLVEKRALSRDMKKVPYLEQ